MTTKVMSTEEEFVPCSKRACLNIIWCKKDEETPFRLYDDGGNYKDICMVLRALQPLLKSVIVKHGGVELLLSQSIPRTSEHDPLHFITEVCKFCKLHGLPLFWFLLQTCM